MTIIAKRILLLCGKTLKYVVMLLNIELMF